MKLTKHFALMIGLLLSPILWATEVLPPSCDPFAITGEVVAMKVDKPTLVVVHNLNIHDLWITPLVKAATDSNVQSSRLENDLWSAMAIERGQLDLTCVESKPGHEQQVSCQDVLAICLWTIPDLGQKDRKGQFWAAENLSMPSLIAYLGRHGFKLPLGKTT